MPTGSSAPSGPKPSAWGPRRIVAASASRSRINGCARCDAQPRSHGRDPWSPNLSVGPPAAPLVPVNVAIVGPAGAGKTTLFNALTAGAACDGVAHRARLSDELRKPDSAGKSRFQSRQQAGVKSIIDPRRGRYARSVSFKPDAARIALDATLRALAASSLRASNPSVHDPTRSSRFSRALPDALRFKLFKRKQGTLFIFALDTSGSMALNRIARAKGVILKLLRQSYLNRDSVAIVAFRGKSAVVSLQPSRSILRARRVLDSLSMGGSTPLSAGLVCTLELVKRVRDRHGEIAVLLFTDGHANVALRGNADGNSERIERQKMIEGEMVQLGVELKKARVSLAVVDTQSGFGSDVDTRRVAEVLDARFVRLHENTR